MKGKLYLKPGEAYDPTGKQQAEPSKLPSVVSLGFFIDAGYKDPNRVSVFNMDTGKAEEVTISQVFEVGTEIAERSDNDPVLSVVRELFFYKLYGDEWEKEHPQRERAGTQVLYKKLPYTLIHTNSQTAKAMIEDAAGNIQVVPYGDITRGKGKTTQGKKDSGFDTQGSNIYSGQWVWVPARSEIRAKYPTLIELGVVGNVMSNNHVEVYCAMDGFYGLYRESDVQIADKALQSAFNVKQSFKQFREGAVEGKQAKTQRLELGSQFAAMLVDQGETGIDKSQPPQLKKPKTSGAPIKQKGSVSVGDTKKAKMHDA